MIYGDIYDIQCKHELLISCGPLAPQVLTLWGQQVNTGKRARRAVAPGARALLLGPTHLLQGRHRAPAVAHFSLETRRGRRRDVLIGHRDEV